MGEKIIAFARKKGDEALACFGRCEWAEGIPRAKAALDLLARAKTKDFSVAEPLYRGICDALAADGKFCEAHEFFCESAGMVADDQVRRRLLQAWLKSSNTPGIGDLVQLPSTVTKSASGHQQLLVGKVLEPVCSDDTQDAMDALRMLAGGAPEEVKGGAPSRWRVQLCGVAGAGDTDMPALANITDEPVPAVTSSEHEQDRGLEVVEVDSSDLTLLTLRLTDEQRERWLQLKDDVPELFGERMRPENEKRWQRLFGGAAARQPGVVGTDASAGAADLGLPLEQSFVATLHGVITDWLKFADQAGGGAPAGDDSVDLVIDLLGCRPALELADPEVQLERVVQASGSRVRNLTIRMCGPEVDCESWRIERQVGDGQRLLMELRPGLYHDAFPEGGADIVVALNAGIGVPQYKEQWTPTLDLLGQQSRRFLLAVTTYSPGELLREEHLLRRRYAQQLDLEGAEEIGAIISHLSGASPWTLSCDVDLPNDKCVLRRGDVIEACPITSPNDKRVIEATVLDGSVLEQCSALGFKFSANGSLRLRILRAYDLAYVGPNPTPGRSRNYGKLLLWVDRCSRGESSGTQA